MTTAAVCEPLSSLYDPVVRDLAWALSSPPLLTPSTDHANWPDAGHYQHLYAGYAEHLQTLDREPSALHRAVAVPRTGRIGQYFEALWRFWLLDNPDYALSAHNLQVRTDGTTLGELDLLVRDSRRERFEHWELAVKFYLGLGATHDLSAWIGPNPQDRLERKLQHLRDHQLPLLRQPATQTLLKTAGLDIEQQRIIMKGRLFYPLSQTTPAPTEAAPGHLRGWWSRSEAFYAHFAGTTLHWFPLPRRHWLAPLRRNQATGLLSAAQLSQHLNDASRPVCVAGFADGDECTRGFIVPPYWPDAE